MKPLLSLGLLLLTLFFLGLAPGEAQTPSIQDPIGFYRMGAEAGARGDYYRALEFYRQALDRNPAYTEALLAAGELYFLLDELDEALVHAQRAEALAPGTSTAGILKGRILAGLGDLSAADETLRSILDREPHNVAARLAKAELDILRGKNAAAAMEILESLNASPNNRRALLSLAVLYQNTGQAEEARRYFELALRHHGEAAETQILAGEFYLRQNMLREAEQRARTALAIQRDQQEALLLLGSVHLARGDYREVYNLMDRILIRHRQNSSAWYLKGLSALRLGRPQEAIELFRSLLNLDPEDEITRITLEDSLREFFPLEDPLRKAFADYHFQRGDRFKDKNLFSRAQEEYRRGLQIDPYSKEGRIAFSDILYKLGYRNRSLQALTFLRRQEMADQEVEERIELVESLLEDRVSRSWGMEEAFPADERFALSIFADSSSGSSLHQDSGIYLARYLGDLLIGSPRFTLTAEAQSIRHYGTAFQESRQRGGEYFIILSFDETEREFSVFADLYLARTGARIDSLQAHRSGNDRIQGALLGIAADLAQKFPARGRLLKRDFEKGLINLGRLDGIQEGDRLLLLPREAITLGHDQLGFVYNPEEILGSIEISRVDDTLSEGLVERRGFFDRINPGDAVIPGDLPPPPDKGGAEAAARPLYKRILRIP